MSLRTKLIIMLLIFIIPTIGLMLVFHSRLITSYQDQVSSFQFDATRLVAGSLKDFYFEGHDILHSVSFQNDKLLHPEECSRTLDRIISDVKIFKSMAVVGLDGRVRCASTRFTLPSNVALLPAFQKAINRDEFALGDNLNYLPGDYVELSMAYPLEGRDGNDAIILGVFDSGNIEAKIKTIGLPDKTEVYFFTPQGQILFPPHAAERSEVRELIRSGKNFFNSGTLTEQTLVIKGSDKLERTFRFVPVDMDKVFIIGIGFPSGEFVRAANQFVTGNIAVISLLTLAILILAYGGIQISVIQPLNMISRTADELAAGNYTARARLGNKNDEIGRLGHIFDRMADALEESRSTLEEETNEKLAYQEKFFRLFEDSILGIFQLDRENRLVEANRALADMFGFSSDEEMITSVNSPAASIFVNQSDTEKINELISQRLPVRMETSFRKKDGSVFDGNLHMWGVWNAAGELEAMEGFVEDITSTKSTRQLVSKLSQAVEQNPIGIIITDGKGGIEYANQGIVKVFGYTPEELALKTMTELIPPSVSPEDVDQMRLALKNGHKYEREIQNYKKDGTPFWERFVVSPITPSHGKVTNTLCLVEDVTEQYLNRERIFQQVEELSALRTIDLAISSNLDLLATLNIISNLAVKHLGVDAVCILFYDAQCHMLHSAVTYGFQQDPGVDIPFPAAADLTDWELMEEFSIHIPENLKENKSTHLLPFPVEEQFQSCFGLPLVAKAEVKGLFVVYRKNAFTPEQHWLDFFYNLATQTAVALDNYELFRNLKQSNTELLRAYEATIEGWSKALKYRDQETGEHSVRTTQWTVDLAKEMGYPVEELVHIRRGALLHDIGKVAVPDGILNKPGPLSESEWKEMKKHPVAAFEVLSPIQFLSRSLDIPYCHHERWNGTGYPRGLKGEEIPLAARIFSVIDVYDALTSDRPYRPAWPEDKVIQYLREQSGIQFDPAVVEAFLSLLEKQKFI